MHPITSRLNLVCDHYCMISMVAFAMECVTLLTLSSDWWWCGVDYQRLPLNLFYFQWQVLLLEGTTRMGEVE